MKGLLEQSLKHRGVAHALLLMTCLFTFFVHNGATLTDIMEARNLTSAYEMLGDEGSWLHPTLNGLLRYEKPPLPTWVAAAIESLSPENVPLQRCAAGVMGVLWVFGLYFLTFVLTRSRSLALAAGVVLATSVNVMLAARTATWDIYCHAFMIWAMVAMLVAYETRGRRLGLFASAGVWMALSLLSKGPVAFYALLLPSLAAYFLVYGRSRRGVGDKRPGVMLAVAVTVVGAAWWPVLGMLSGSGFAHAMAGEAHAWVSYSTRPWHYYIMFPFESGIWSIFLVTAMVFYPYWRRRMTHGKVYAFGVLWLIFALVLLSVVPEKKMRYLLPTLAPMSLMVGVLLYHWWAMVQNFSLTRLEKVLWKVNAYLVTAVVCALPVALYFMLYRVGHISTGQMVLWSVLALWVGASGISPIESTSSRSAARWWGCLSASRSLPTRRLCRVSRIPTDIRSALCGTIPR